MAESAYHMEALRRTRVIERKKQAMDRLLDGGVEGGAEIEGGDRTKDTILFTGPGDYDANRPALVPSHRIYHRKADNTPEDKVYPLIHPEQFKIPKPITKLPPRKPHFKV